jgi:c-di-GMP-binding flagellar brake protein YcgR
MDLAKLNIIPGTPMQLSITKSDGEKLPCKFVGMNAGRSIIISTPVKNDRAILVRMDQEVNISFIASNHACVFTTSIRHICTTPYHYLHLRFPNKVQAGEIRNSTRVEANIRVQITNKSNASWTPTSGLITDLSTTGAKLEALAACSDIDDELLLTAKVTVGKMSRIVKWPAHVKAEIKNFESTNAIAAYGIEFGKLTDLDYLSLYAFVNTQVANGAER